VRYAFHDAGEADIRVSDGMGPDGCLSNTAANSGLIEPTSLIQTVLEPIWQQQCDKISRSDFFVLFAKLVLQAAETTGTIGLIPFQYGRRQNTVCLAGQRRLPDAQLGLAEYTRVFVDQMGLTLTDGVTLVGAHSLGHVHPASSGYGTSTAPATIQTNAWVPNPTVFSNQYYTNMINPNWRNGVSAGSNTLNIWTIANNNIMLNSDMIVGFNIDLTSNGNCLQCGTFGQRCGSPGGVSQCTVPVATTSSTFSIANTYRQNNAAFLSAFTASFNKMTSVTYAAGQLTPIDLSTCPATLTVASSPDDGASSSPSSSSHKELAIVIIGICGGVAALVLLALAARFILSRNQPINKVGPELSAMASAYHSAISSDHMDMDMDMDMRVVPVVDCEMADASIHESSCESLSAHGEAATAIALMKPSPVRSAWTSPELPIVLSMSPSVQSFEV